jgi:hypothetical protein
MNFPLKTAMLAASFLAFAPQTALAGGDEYIGNGHNGHYGREMVVVIDAVVSSRPAPGYETGIMLREGAVVSVSHCDEFGWCHLVHPLFRAAVPARCLERVTGYDRYRNGPKGRHERHGRHERDYDEHEERDYSDGDYRDGYRRR